MTTTAGDRLLTEAPDWDYFGDRAWGSLADHVDAIEAEAAAAERARMEDAVRALVVCGYATPCGTGIREDEPCETCAARDAVLGLLAPG